MKKSLFVVSALAALAMLFVSCGDPTDEPGTSDPATGDAKEYVLYDSANGAAFDPWSQSGQFSKSDLNTYIAKDADAKFVVVYTLNDYTPQYDNDGVGKIHAWDSNWKNINDVSDDFKFDTKCTIADFVAGTEVKGELKASDIAAIPGMDHYTVNMWPVSEGGPSKVEVKKIYISYKE